MREKNSSSTRVKPLMQYLWSFDHETFRGILNLMHNESNKKHFTSIGGVFRVSFSDGRNKEIALPVAIERWTYLIKDVAANYTEAQMKKGSAGKTTKDKRMELISPNLEEAKVVLEKALSEIMKIQHDQDRGLMNTTSDWFVLEGASKPDIFIESDQYIFVGEAKRTEKDFTASTSFDQERHQLVRHIEGARNYLKAMYGTNSRKQVISFYIVDESFIKIKPRSKKPQIIDILKATEEGSPDIWDKSLKHLSERPNKAEMKAEIKACKKTYIGYVTWQEIHKAYPHIVFQD